AWLAARYWALPPSADYAFAVARPWIPALGIEYRIGIDGVSLIMILLTALLTPICVLASWHEIRARRKEFMALLLLVGVGVNGAFAALDLFLFYIFWEVMLIPMYFLVGMWGGPKRIPAAMKFLLYTMVGSVLMLVALLYLYFAGGKTFNLLALYGTVLSPTIQCWLFAAFALAFAIKVPLFPFHTWLPDAHTEAPTAGSILLAGVFLKVGVYGFYRFAMPLFPDAVLWFRPAILVLSVVGIVGGALVSMVQPEVKRLIAYSSVSHLGFVMLGLFALTPEGVQGAVIQMLNHGLSTGALFLLFGMLYERSHQREIAAYGGLAKRLPLFAACFLVVSLSSIGLPGLNNFVGEFLILLGTFRAEPVYGAVAAFGVVLGAVYLLWLVERVFFGPEPSAGDAGHAPAWRDLGVREGIAVLPLIALCLWLGIAPGGVLARTLPSATAFLRFVEKGIAPVPPIESVGLFSPPLSTGVGLFSRELSTGARR
ncbi:MAG: NADH-quinone oxidoreductase subunit M, partial [Deltaproteobacteria bacterium]|nr:NADH-quinone oxidoreductase subunit M [Deltaproteobacteria bacterium]